MRPIVIASQSFGLERPRPRTCLVLAVGAVVALAACNDGSARRPTPDGAPAVDLGAGEALSVDAPASDAAAVLDGSRSDRSPDGAPSGLTAASKSTTTVTLSWTDNSSGETAFEVERWDEGAQSWSVVGSVGQDTTTFTDTGLSAATEYGYRVYAATPGGRLGPSNEAWVITNAPSSDAGAPSSDAGAPAGTVLYSNCWSGGSCTGAGSNNGWVRTVETNGCYSGSCLKLVGTVNTNSGAVGFGAGSTSIGATINSKKALTVVYRVKFNKPSNNIAGGNFKGHRPFYGPDSSNYMLGTIDVHNMVSPAGFYEGAHNGMLMDVEPVVDAVRTLYYPAYCQLVSGNTYECPTRVKVVFTINGATNFGTQWREVRHYIKMPTSAATKDGEWRMWIDGVLVLRAYNVGRKSGGTDYFTKVLFYPSSEATEAFEHWMDEMVIYEGLVSP